MNFPLPSARVALFPANTAKNLHMLRVPDIGHVFIGHGDSDKAASFNPYTKVYDEVWVAGRAGRDRYLRAQVGVRDEDIVEVGPAAAHRDPPGRRPPGGPHVHRAVRANMGGLARGRMPDLAHRDGPEDHQGADRPRAPPPDHLQAASPHRDTATPGRRGPTSRSWP